MSKKIIKWAAREKRRSVTKGVGKSFLKTATEPITNSDSILKKKEGVEHSAGLVDLILKVPNGQQLNTEMLKRRFPKTAKRRIILEVITAGRLNRRCRIVDCGLGMTKEEVEKKFGDYAEAKAKGEKTRSLFGRGALDVLLYHDDAFIYSVKDGELVRCRFFWENEPMQDAETLGKPTASLLKKHDLPAEIAGGGTVVEFCVHPDTPIPAEDQIIARLCSFYMLRLIAADPNTEVLVRRLRGDGWHEDALTYDFPVGTVIGRFSDSFDVPGHAKLPVDILVARADVALPYDPDNIERRGNGLLFVDENDAVLDLSLTGDFDRSPYLRNMYGLVRITGIRAVLEAMLEAKNPEAILSETRDGFERRHPLTIALFNLVSKHVRPLFENEERRQQKGDSKRSEVVKRRLNDVLRAFNQFNADETEEEGEGPGPKPPPPPVRPDAIYFEVDSTSLHVGVTRRISAYVNLSRVAAGEIVLFETTNQNIRVLPESSIVEAKGRGERMQIPIHVTCDVKGETGAIEAITLDKDGKEHRARCEVRGVGDAPVPRVPDDIEFSGPSFTGNPNRENKATLLVNLDAFPGKPEITFWLDDVVGNVNLAGGKRVQIKVSDKDIVANSRVARVTVGYRGNAWGQRAVLHAKAKKKDGTEARAKCRLKFDVSNEGNKFSDIRYHDLGEGRNALGDVAENIVYINSRYPLHKQIFGETEEEFNRSLENDVAAQIRAASILVETVIYNSASTKWEKGGKKGLDIRPKDPVGSVRGYLDESRIKLEARVYRALVVAQPESLEEAS